MRDTTVRVSAIAFGVLVVTSMAFAPIGGNSNSAMVQEASADPLLCMEGPIVVVDTTYFTGGDGVCSKAESDVNKLNATEALETKKNIYDSASTQTANNDVLQTSFGNYLNDTKSIARMEGKSAYIKALENGTSEAEARNRAIDAVANYYAVKQQNLISAWNITHTLAFNMRATAEGHSGVSNNYIDEDGGPWKNSGTHPFAYGMQNNSITLTNGSSVGVIGIKGRSVSPNGNYYAGYTWHPNDPATVTVDGGTTWDVRFSGYNVQPPNDNYDVHQLHNQTKFDERWAQIESQNDLVQSEVDTFVNNTFDQYQQGQINASDLVDPYLGARDYDPENGSSYALRALASMGINPPENISTTSEMVVSVGATNYTGILMSKGTPEGGYVVGGSYNASNIPGAQFVALSDGGTQELTGEFTLERYEKTDGTVVEEGDTVTYKNITYETSDMDEYQALQNDLKLLSQQINERQETVYAGGGGGGSGGPTIPDWLKESYFGVPLYGLLIIGLGGTYVVNSFRTAS